MEDTHRRDINIKGIANGWLVKVGCMTIAFTEIDKMLGEVRRYYLNPEDVEREYIEKYGKNF